jgi:hypothetical protein
LTGDQARDLLRRHQVRPLAGVEAWVEVRRARRRITAGLLLAGSRPPGAAEAQIDPLEGLSQGGANRLAGESGLRPEARGAASDLLLRLWDIVCAGDLLELRVAPGRAAASLDRAAAFRHPEWSRYGVALDPRGGPYLARAEAIAAADQARPPAPTPAAARPALDELVIDAYRQSRGLPTHPQVFRGGLPNTVGGGG